MIEETGGRCFVLWTESKRGKIYYDPVIYSSAAAAINQGEQRLAKKEINNYNYSVVMAPVIDKNIFHSRPLTSEPNAPSIEL